MGKELEEGRVKGWREIREGEGYSNQNDIYMYVLCMCIVCMKLSLNGCNKDF